MELHNWNLSIIIITTDSGKNHQCILKQVANILGVTEYLHSLAISPIKVFTIYK
jgi:hypothetical protein